MIFIGVLICRTSPVTRPKANYGHRLSKKTFRTSNHIDGYYVTFPQLSGLAFSSSRHYGIESQSKEGADKNVSATVLVTSQLNLH